MAVTPTHRLAFHVLESDRTALQAIRDLSDYMPMNAAYSAETLQALEATLTYAIQAEMRAKRTLDQARDDAIAAGHAFHEAILAARTHVIAQYGNSSHEVQAVGLKKKSERKRPVRRTPRASI